MDKRIHVILIVSIIISFCLGAIAGTNWLGPALNVQATATMGSVPAISATPASTVPDTTFISYLFVQEGQSGSLAKGENGTLVLTIHGIRDDTVYFSDRPVKISGLIDTTLFSQSAFWTESDKPNAALMLPDAPEANDTVIITLSDPQYDKPHGTLVYTATLVPDYRGDGLKAYKVFVDPAIPDTFGRVMLFIDSATIQIDFSDQSNTKDTSEVLVFP